MKPDQYKKIALIIVIGAVVLLISYLNSQKVQPNFDLDEELTVAEESLAQGSVDDKEEPQYVSSPEVIKTKLKNFKLAPELKGIAGYINTDPSINIEDLKGKVVLIDFWTYSCINCIRTLPYLRAWNEKYEDDGLVIIGVHTPEFGFEKEIENVKNAVEENGIEYAVVQDNDYRTWRAYENRYWPRKYLIDIDGFIRYDKIGEGGYERTEEVIQELLNERMEVLGQEDVIEEKIESPEDVIDVEFGGVKSPEIYFGYKFARGNFGNPEGFKPGEIVKYSLPQYANKNKAYLSGEWLNTEDYMELVSDTGTILLIYDSKIVNIVAGSDNGVEITVLVDLMPVDDDNKGPDVVNSNIVVENHKLYSIVDGEYGENLLSINVNEPGLRIYTFTFG